MRTAAREQSFEEIMRQAHAERARVVSELFANALVGLWHLAQRATALATAGLSNAVKSGDDAYLDGSPTRFDRKRRLLLLQQRQAQIALDVGH
jgi:hypothetical protein